MFSYFSCRTRAYEVVCHCTLARFQPDSSVICQDLKNQQPFSILVMPPVLQIAAFFGLFSFRAEDDDGRLVFSAVTSGQRQWLMGPMWIQGGNRGWCFLRSLGPW